MKQTQADHDLLIELRTEMRSLRDDVREIKDNVVGRVETLEELKLSKIEADKMKEEAEKIHTDHEKRLRRVEQWGSIAIGALGLIEFLTRFIK